MHMIENLLQWNHKNYLKIQLASYNQMVLKSIENFTLFKLARETKLEFSKNKF